MTVVDLHPETLLDRALSGELEAEERTVLDAHLVTCPACAVHLEARTLFRTELDERDGDAALDLASIDRAMVAAGAEAVQPLVYRRRWSVRLFMAALVLGGIAAGAHYGTRPRSTVSFTSQPAGIPSEEATGRRTGLEQAQTAEQPAEGTQGGSQPETAAAGPSSAGSPMRARGKPATGKAILSEGPDELFARANQLRRSGRDSEAMALYRELQRAYPDSRQARLSQATLARLQLDHGQASEALSGFDSYLKSGDTGAMTEDALVGRAMALMKLNQRDQERATWQELLARFPNSIHASRARARLGELR
jgi:TolA-binding protein